MSLKTLVRAVSTMALLFCTLQIWPQSPAAPKPVLTEELPSGSMHDKAVTACTECHEARIIVQQRLGRAAWAKEVDKMVKWGAVVDTSDRDALIDYLSKNFGTDRPPYVPPRTSSIKAAPQAGASR
jgi:hypothetical protein